MVPHLNHNPQVLGRVDGLELFRGPPSLIERRLVRVGRKFMLDLNGWLVVENVLSSEDEPAFEQPAPSKSAS